MNISVPWYQDGERCVVLHPSFDSKIFASFLQEEKVKHHLIEENDLYLYVYAVETGRLLIKKQTWNNLSNAEQGFLKGYCEGYLQGFNNFYG